MEPYADVIIDLSVKNVDRIFQYRIPDHLKELVKPGVQVNIPFGKGNTERKGIVVGLSKETDYDPEKMKELLDVETGAVPIRTQMICLAFWMKDRYSTTMNQALKTVLPVKAKVMPREERVIVSLKPKNEIETLLIEAEKKKYRARIRLYRALLENGELPLKLTSEKLGITAAMLKPLVEKEIVDLKTVKKEPGAGNRFPETGPVALNQEQKNAAETVIRDYDSGQRNTYLLYGITGSGKTEVYMELIDHVLRKGRQAIVLIPEISLTYQTVMRFFARFGNRVSIINSRLSNGERYDQFERAKNGDIDIMIGPRSALFTPFSKLGLIIIDEEHESSYKSETLPRYHARETAIERARMCGASVVLGSATPSVESYYKAKTGEYELLELKHRVAEKPLPKVEVVDLREELKAGNRSILSVRLQELMEDRLKKGQQMMLFINRRGVAGFVSCRACGHVLKCPHCDVSLSQHVTRQHPEGKMVCHYCGYEIPMPKTCPACGSRYISGFKAGTQKIEMIVRERFPQARVLRMDMDTTRNKEGYEQILSAFANQEADILIGTQMIVKGHDFPNVTLVGVLAADLSLYVSDYHAAERTFQLLTQAAGRAGRGSEPGEVVIQTYRPDHYSVQTAKEQDYEAFYEQEMEYRRMLLYPPVWNMLVILCASKQEQTAYDSAKLLVQEIDTWQENIKAAMERVGEDFKKKRVFPVGPADPAVAKVNDIYKKVIYIKTKDYQTLVELKDRLEHYMRDNKAFKDMVVQFDFNPMSGF